MCVCSCGGDPNVTHAHFETVTHGKILSDGSMLVPVPPGPKVVLTMEQWQQFLRNHSTPSPSP